MFSENNLKRRTLSDDAEAKLLPFSPFTFATWFCLRCIPACDQAIYFGCNGRTSIITKWRAIKSQDRFKDVKAGLQEAVKEAGLTGIT